MTKQKVHTTNYFDTFIEVAEDTKANCGTKPVSKSGNKTLAEVQYDLLMHHPYEFTSDDVFFTVFAEWNDLGEAERKKARQVFFSKGQACFRSSPLTKAYGFGVHANSEGRVAIYGMETESYEKFRNDPGVKKVKAMRSSKS